uniref:Uncharacterized protein n=1 Tax=Romanomermis culicivorax TaxID=13658 RepID=A0A915HNY2_ROMCU
MHSIGVGHARGVQNERAKISDPKRVIQNEHSKTSDPK